MHRKRMRPRRPPVEHNARFAPAPRTSPRFPPVRNVALVALGGSLGALARVALGGLFEGAPRAFPVGTFLANMSGALLLAALLTILVERSAVAAWARPLIGTGVLGSYTTFATLSLEVHLLVAARRVGLAALYLGTTLAAGLVMTRGGIWLARHALRVRREQS